MQAAAAAAAWLALRPVLALAGLVAVRPVAVHAAVDVTSGSRLSRGAEAPSRRGIARSLVVAVTCPAAAESVGALVAHSVAAGPAVPRRTLALA